MPNGAGQQSNELAIPPIISEPQVHFFTGHLDLVTSPDERLNEKILADLSETNHFIPAPENPMILKMENNL
jgi:hypothetical protein